MISDLDGSLGHGPDIFSRTCFSSCASALKIPGDYLFEIHF